MIFIGRHTKKTLSWRRRIAYLAGFTSMSLLVVLLGLEVVLRVSLAAHGSERQEPFLAPSKVPGLGFVLAPDYEGDHVQTDTRGLRRRPPDACPPERTILVLGDSVAFGGAVPYSKNFTALLESTLTASLGKSVAVWNAGVPGYNTEQERILFSLLGPVVRPDLVLVQFCLNDYLDPPALASSGDLDVTRFDERRGATLRGLLYRSKALFFLKERFKDLEKLYPNLFPTGLHYVHYLHDQPGWQRAREALVRLHAASLDLGAGFLLVIFPVEQQLRIDDRAPQEDLMAFAKEHGIPALDLFESFRREWRQGLFIDYSKRLGAVDKLHLSEKGHALAARLISHYLETDGRRLLGKTR